MFTVDTLSTKYNDVIQTKINNKTKPLGALGQLEDIARQIASIQYQQTNSSNVALAIKKPTLIVFAGDHGVAAEGVSIAPSEVTGQMLTNFAQGGAAINVFCRQLNWQLKLVDAGVLNAPDAELLIINQRLGCGTHAINKTAAMIHQQVLTGFEFSKKLVQQQVESGCNFIAFGEMGIGNTTSAAAIMSAIMKIPATDTVGLGTGISNEILIKKQQVVDQALILHQQHLNDPISILACLGGFEIVQITGAILAAAEQGITIIIDGFICTAAAMLAYQLNNNARDYMIFAHCSGEQGHQKMLTWLEATPLLNLDLRLGEGSGAALSLPLIQAAVAFYNDMASFEQAEVTDVIS